MRQWPKATVELIANPSAALGPAEVLLFLFLFLFLLCYTLVSLDSLYLCLVMAWLPCTSPHLIP
jgi:hypothetical protein